MATVIAFPLEAAPPPPPDPAPLFARSEYDLADVARRVSLLHFTERTIVGKLRILAAKHGLPLPRTPRIVNGEVIAGVASIHSKSRWNAGEVDAWLDGRGPAAPAAPAPRIAPALVIDMQHRAAALAQGAA